MSLTHLSSSVPHGEGGRLEKFPFWFPDTFGGSKTILWSGKDFMIKDFLDPGTLQRNSNMQLFNVFKKDSAH